VNPQLIQRSNSPGEAMEGQRTPEAAGASRSTLLTPGRVIATLVVFGLIVAVGYAILSGMKSAGTPRVALPGSDVSVAATVPPDHDIPTIDGNTLKLSAYRGKVLVVDFWAIWCPPCRKEVPQLTRLAEANRGKGLEVVGLHIDDRGRSSSQAIREFIRQYGISYTVGIASDEVFVDYLGDEETAIPQTLVFDRDGKLVEHLVGYGDKDARKLDTAVNGALAR
jgi:thiol-disulfide isomerase/thioredoxin